MCCLLLRHCVRHRLRAALSVRLRKRRHKHVCICLGIHSRLVVCHTHLLSAPHLGLPRIILLSCTLTLHRGRHGQCSHRSAHPFLLLSDTVILRIHFDHSLPMSRPPLPPSTLIALPPSRRSRSTRLFRVPPRSLAVGTWCVPSRRCE
jgi:hypothetical protein